MRIYAAGAEGLEFTRTLHMLGYPFRLASYFYMKDQKSHGKDMILHSMKNDKADWIIDSGLFSFMFGSKQGTLSGYDQYKAYAEKYVEEVKSWGWNQIVVECDVQRVLGVPETERLREEVFRPSGLDVMYVWHIPDGEDGLRELARREKRIALSIPELRQVLGSGFSGGMKVKRAVIHLLSVIRKSKGNPSIHLLGNTEVPLMDLPAYSCDSTGWLAPGRYGVGLVYEPTKRRFKQISIHSPKWKAWRGWCARTYPEVFKHLKTIYVVPQQLQYYGNDACHAIGLLLYMEARAGKDLQLPIPKRLVGPMMKEFKNEEG